ncbi:MAG: hypothetical protein EPN23_06380 [Verrucomicrobia bacterium]|nr:MAG: hypothetical protein EPN23_06380 [Verrucomicrobiota bacterium]
MAMLISKFHRLIQSRLLWGAFLVIIVFSFVIWGTKMPGSSRRDREERAEGLFNGKPVSPEEFRQAYFNSRLAVGLMTGRPPMPGAETEKALRKAAWQRIAEVYKAQELGLPRTTDAEVIATIQHQPIFQAEGRFDERRFATFVRNGLAELGVNEVQFEDYLREEMLLEKLRLVVASTLLIPPSDAQTTVASVSDQFRVEYAVIAPDTNAGARVTIKEAQALYNRDPKTFTVPEKVRVQYVEFPFSNYVASATASADEALNYYNEHMDRFTRMVSITNPPPFGATNAAPTISQRSDQIPFEQVTNTIYAALKNAAARTHAEDVASEFVGSLSPDRHGKALTFAQAAAKYGQAVHVAGPFADGEPVAGLEDVTAFNRTAFALGTNTDERFSDVIKGPTSALVLHLDARLPARVPPFAEVAPRALEEARTEAKAAAQEAKANQLRAALLKASPTQPFGVTTMTLTGTVLALRSSTNEYAETLLRAATTRNAGELCEVLRAYDGNLLVARVAERKRAEAATINSLLPQVQASLQHQRARALDETYAAYLLKAAKLEDRRDKPNEEAGTPARAMPPRNAVPADVL